VANLTGSSTAEINAPIDQVWAVVEDVESAPQWQGGLDGLRALERDQDDRATLCETESDIKVRKVKSIVRFTYAGPELLTWSQEKGELKSVDGRWELEDLGDGRTQATYAIEVNLGRMLGMLVRGPVEGAIRSMLVGARAGELKRRMEGG
jgi:ribosome-associated toxin RatA of RatAB toxin-antitoxin module